MRLLLLLALCPLATAAETPSWVSFVGRFHLVLLHLPIGLLLGAAFCALLRLLRPIDELVFCTGLLLLMAAVTAIPAAISGWLLAESGDYAQDLLEVHRWSGAATALLSCLAAVLHCINRRRASLVLLALAVPVLLLAVYSGVSLTHGRNHLLDMAPWHEAQPADDDDTAPATVTEEDLDPDAEAPGENDSPAEPEVKPDAPLPKTPTTDRDL